MPGSSGPTQKERVMESAETKDGHRRTGKGQHPRGKLKKKETSENNKGKGRITKRRWWGSVSTEGPPSDQSSGFLNGKKLVKKRMT